jgi:hypothetical protein
MVIDYASHAQLHTPHAGERAPLLARNFDPLSLSPDLIAHAIMTIQDS